MFVQPLVPPRFLWFVFHRTLLTVTNSFSTTSSCCTISKRCEVLCFLRSVVCCRRRPPWRAQSFGSHFLVQGQSSPGLLCFQCMELLKGGFPYGLIFIQLLSAPCCLPARADTSPVSPPQSFYLFTSLSRLQINRIVVGYFGI